MQIGGSKINGNQVSIANPVLNGKIWVVDSSELDQTLQK